MSEDLDRIESQFRAQEYMIENPKKVLQMDPDQGGNRGFNGAMTDSGPGPKEQGSEDVPTAANQPVSQAVDTVIVSPAAQRLLDQIGASPAKKAQPPSTPAPPAPPVEQPHVDLTA